MLYSKIEGSGQPLVIMHGFLGMSDNWKTLGTQFVEQGYQVHLLDLRNHGRSFHSDDFSYELMVQDVYDYCSANYLANIDIIGHSMGGKVAMLLAATYPELIRKLVVADIGPKYYAPHHQDILRGLNSVDFSTKPSRNEVDALLSVAIPDFGTRQFLLKSLYWKEPGQLAFRFNLNVFNQKIEQIGKPLPEDSYVDLPTLFIRGGNSKYIEDNDIPEIKRQFPNSDIKTILGAGHWLHAENPALFFEFCMDFFKK